MRTEMAGFFCKKGRMVLVKKRLVALLVCLVMVASTAAALADDFVSNGIYAAICGIIDSNMGDYSPTYNYDEDKKVMSVIIHANLGGVSLLVNGSVDSDTWQSVLDGQNGFSDTLHTSMVELGYDVDCVLTCVENSGDMPVVILVSCNGYTAYDIVNSK